MNAFYLDRTKQCAGVQHIGAFDKATHGQTVIINKKMMKICELIGLKLTDKVTQQRSSSSVKCQWSTS